MTYLWDFGDGSNLTTTASNVSHIYSTKGIYNVTIQASNLLSQKENISSIIVQDSIQSFAILSSASVVSEIATFVPSFSNASDYFIDFNMGDNSAGFILSEVDVIGNNYQINHTYTAEGVYLVAAHAFNNVSSAVTSILHVVQYAITGLQMVKEGAEKNSPFSLEFQIATGTNVTCEITFDSLLEPHTFDPITNKGITPTLPVKPAGIYDLKVNCWNLVSNVTINVNFTIETRITGTTCAIQGAASNEILVNDSLTIDVSVGTGSSVALNVDYKDGSPNDTFPAAIGQDWNLALNPVSYSHMFASPGIYDITVTSSNNLNQEVCTIQVKVYNEVKDIGITSNSPVPYVRDTGGDIIIQFFAGGEAPTDALLKIDYGDGTVQSGIQFSTLQSFHHRYSDAAEYTIIANVSNKISHQIIHHSVAVLIPVVNMRIHLFPNHAPKNTQVLAGISMDQASNVTVCWHWGESGVTWDHCQARIGK